MRKFGLAAVAAAVLSIAVAVPAQAAVFLLTYTGKVESGIDALGLFGAAGADLSGIAAELSFKYATEIGRVTTPSEDYVQSGGGRPVLLVTMTVNGQRFFQSLNDVSALGSRVTMPGRQDLFAQSGLNISGSIRSDFFALGAFAPPLAAIDQLLSTDLTDSRGSFAIGNGPASTRTRGDFSFDHVTITASAAPEPGQWGLMILGFSAVGGLARTRRRAAAAA